ncbi:MAG TPA: aminoacyl-tRNA hydrolase [Candidatus Eremiobacteraceae bacterium]|jgi:PTH1 family peptidyl-tRNA hydrolase
MRLVVGLGNPGAQYVRTRHNIGFRVVQALAAAEEVETWRSKFNARIAQVPALDAVIAMPQTYMNDSGAAVQPLAAFYKLTPAELLVVCDDFNLPFGRLRLRRGGSDGGNNGLKDITSALGTQEYPRLRFGIGRNGMDAIGFVLGAFSGDEEKEIPEAIDRALAGIRTFCLQGTDAAIAVVNSNNGDAVP